MLQRAVAGNEAIALRANSGTNVQVVSNLVYHGPESIPQHSCFSHQARSSCAAFDHNLCHHADGTGNWSPAYPTPGAAAQGGFDAHGLAVDPLFVTVPVTTSGWQDLIQALSPAREAGHPTVSSSTDWLGAPRTVPSIGAREPVARPKDGQRSAPVRKGVTLRRRVESIGGG